ncbi:MAG: hypothetical protein J1E85_09360 [Ruminococcus sp.]|nr:hypothetical protein [Ruminococcus sp.]
MNIIELVKSILQSFPKINEVCNDIHIDFTDRTNDSYGLSSIGDALLAEDVLGNQRRQHNFILYAVFQSANDYDRLNNSGVLLELQLWLERQAQHQEFENIVDNEKLTGVLTKLTCSNGMLYAIPENNLNSGVQYQMQITAEYKIER